MTTRGLPDWPWTGHDTADLPLPEALLIDATRRWAAAWLSGRPTLPAIMPPFVAEDATDAAGPAEAMIRAVASGRSLRVGLPAAPQVVGDEALLLLACTICQRASRTQALAAWCAMLPPQNAYRAMGHALVMGSRLRLAGLVLSPPFCQPSCQARAGRDL